MRFLARLSLGLCGLALVTSAVVKADDPAAPPSNAARAAGCSGGPVITTRVSLVGGIVSNASAQYAKKHDGVDVPPPPSTPAAAAMAGTIIHDHNQGTACAVCQAGTFVSGPVSVVESYPPGHAVADGPVLAGNLPPGYAVVGGGGPQMAGADPTPVGVSRAAQTQWNNSRLASMPPRAGVASYDPSVQPSSMIPPQTALDTQTTSRPHILSHLFGIGGISRQVREEREDKSAVHTPPLLMILRPSRSMTCLPRRSTARAIEPPAGSQSVGQDRPIPAHVAGDRTFRGRWPRDSVEIDAGSRRWSKARSDHGTGGQIRAVSDDGPGS